MKFGKTSARNCNLISFESISKSWRVADWLRRQIWGSRGSGVVIGWLVGAVTEVVEVGLDDRILSY